MFEVKLEGSLNKNNKTWGGGLGGILFHCFNLSIFFLMRPSKVFENKQDQMLALVKRLPHG